MQGAKRSRLPAHPSLVVFDQTEMNTVASLRCLTEPPPEPTNPVPSSTLLSQHP